MALYDASDSFAILWGPLAADFGFAMERIQDPNQWLARPGLKVASVGGMENRFAAAMIDLGLDGRGPIVAVGADSHHRTAMHLIRSGVSDYFALPADLPLLRAWLEEQVANSHRALAQRAFTAAEEAKYRFEGMIGTSAALRQALAVATRVIPRATVTVLITGETGTGKELLARAIHYNGPRRDAPFIDVNCAAIPENLLESELFGHEKGSFTGATSAKPGLFEVANGGTIFLDEIGHMPLQLQGKLLRALEQRLIRRVGGMRSMPIDVRVVAATHVNLPEAVRRGEFREDLYYRLNVLPLLLPPLRTRGDDVVLLANHFLERFAHNYGMPQPALSRGAETRLKAHPWAGNVRELRNVIERTLLMHTTGEIDGGSLLFRSPADLATTGDVPFPATMREITRRAALAMVERYHGNKSAAARRLAISRTRLLRLLDTNHSDLEDEEIAE